MSTTTPSLSLTPILKALHDLPTDALERGMNAFSHPPRGRYAPEPGVDAYGCFVWEAQFRHTGVGFVPAIEALNREGQIYYLSTGYECYNEWFKGECLRELAERGATPEPPVPAREAATC